MAGYRHRNGPQPSVRSFCRSLYIWVLWARVAATLPQTANENDAATHSSTTSHVALIPSAPRPTALIPSERRPTQSSTPLPTNLIPSQPQPPPVLVPSQPQTFTITSQAGPPSAFQSSTIRQPGGLIPSGPPPISNPPSYVSNSNSSIIITSAIKDQPSGSNPPNVTFTIPVPSKVSTTEGLNPIPAPSSDPGSPDGHHEIPEPNLTATAPCRNCNPDMQVPATGWNDLPTSTSHIVAEPQESPAQPKGPPNQATITVGPSSIVIKPAPTGQVSASGGEPGGGGGGGGGGQPGGGEEKEKDDGNYNDEDVHFIIGDSTTVQLGQTVTINQTPVVIQTSADRTEVVLSGTKTIPFETPSQALITDPPLVILPLIIESQTVTPVVDSNKKSNGQTPTIYVVQGQTLVPGGTAITVQGTTFSVPSAAPSAIVVNGETTTITPGYGVIIPTTTIPHLTLFESTFTANAAGNYIIGPGTTLRPGAEAITVSGTVISLKPGNTEVVVQGSTSQMVPATTVVTVTRSGGGGYIGNDRSPSGTAGTALPYPAGGGRTKDIGLGLSGSLEGVALLGVLAVGWLAVWL